MLVTLRENDDASDRRLPDADHGQRWQRGDARTHCLHPERRRPSRAPVRAPRDARVRVKLIDGAADPIVRVRRADVR